MAEEREQRQLKLIEEFAALAAGARVECWLQGGWALDFLLGRITRPHQDIDLFIWAADAPRLLGVLRQHGYEEIGGPPRNSSATSLRSERSSTSRCLSAATWAS